MKDYIGKVFRKFLGYKYPPGTERKVQDWIVDEQNAEEKRNFLYNYWTELNPEPESTIYSSLEAVRRKAGLEQQAQKIFMRKRILRVAAVLFPLLLLAGGYFFYDDSFVDSSLSRVTVPYGERKEVVLPDGTKVWINAGSTLQYPDAFAADNRTVRLSGEAYFEVERDEARPFIVETRKLSVRVLGTEFNVSAYPDDGQIVTTLNSGKVAVETDQEEALYLEPDQQLAFNKKTREVSIQSVVASDYSEWKSGHLLLDNVTLDEMIKALERTYNVKIKAGKSLKSRTDRFTAKFVTNESLEQALDIIGAITNITYERKGDEVRLNEQ